MNNLVWNLWYIQKSIHTQLDNVMLILQRVVVLLTLLYKEQIYSTLTVLLPLWTENIDLISDNISVVLHWVIGAGRWKRKDIEERICKAWLLGNTLQMQCILFLTVHYMPMKDNFLLEIYKIQYYLWNNWLLTERKTYWYRKTFYTNFGNYA